MRTADAAQRRQLAIELLLLWEGAVSNARLRELFSVHVTMASRDLAAYRAAHEGQLQPSRAGQLVATPWARPILSTGKFAEYLELIGLDDAGNGDLATVPVSTVLTRVPTLSFMIVRAVQQAIRQQCGLLIEYGSLNHPVRHARTIFPHAIAKAGARWHLRAWCEQRKAYCDFNLGRVFSARLSETSAPAQASGDKAWLQMVDVRLAPHPALSSDQQRLVRDEYMGGTSALVTTTRLALVPYVVQAYRAAVDVEKQLPPEYLLHVVSGERYFDRRAMFLSDDDA